MQFVWVTDSVHTPVSHAYHLTLIYRIPDPLAHDISRGVGKPRTTVAARRNIRRPSILPNIYLTKSQASKEVLEDPSPGNSDPFHLNNIMRHENLDVHGEKPVHNDAGKLCLENMAKQAAPKEHYEHFSDVVFLLLPQGHPRQRLWTCIHHKMFCHMGQIQWASAHPHLLPIFHHLKRNSL